MARFVCGILCIAALFATCNTSTNTNYTPKVNTNSFDYKYSKARFKTEGYSNKDSEVAAEAIMKFYQSQQNRSR
jgi:hypothetical protein